MKFLIAILIALVLATASFAQLDRSPTVVSRTPTETVRETPTETVRETPTETVRETPTANDRVTPTETVRETPTANDRVTPTETVRETPTETVRETPTANDRVTPTETVRETTPVTALPCQARDQCTCLADTRCHYCGAVVTPCGLSDRIDSVCNTVGREPTRVPCDGAAPTPVREAPLTDDRVATEINSGRVTEAAVNDRLASEPVDTLIIVVTIITQAETRNRETHFQTFVDVTGDFAPTNEQRLRICEALKRTLGGILNVDLSSIRCGLTERNIVKRVTTSFVADMHVANEENGAAAFSVAIALAASPLALLLN